MSGVEVSGMKKIFSAFALLAIVACGPQKPAPAAPTAYLNGDTQTSISVERKVTFKKVGNCYKKVVTYTAQSSYDTQPEMWAGLPGGASACFNAEQQQVSCAGTPPPTYTGSTIGEAVTKFQRAEFKESQ